MSQKVNSFTIPIHNTNKVEYSSLKEFFRLFFIYIRPYHKLSIKETIIASELYRRKYELSKVILDGELLDSITLNPENKRIIKDNVGGINNNQFNVTIAKFKKLGIIKNGRISPRFMPAISDEMGRFNMVFSFNYNENSKSSFLESLEKNSKRNRKKNEVIQRDNEESSE